MWVPAGNVFAAGRDLTLPAAGAVPKGDRSTYRRVGTGATGNRSGFGVRRLAARPSRRGPAGRARSHHPGAEEILLSDASRTRCVVLVLTCRRIPSQRCQRALMSAISSVRTAPPLEPAPPPREPAPPNASRAPTAASPTAAPSEREAVLLRSRQQRFQRGTSCLLVQK